MKKICHFSKLLYCILILAGAGIQAYAQAPDGSNPSSIRRSSRDSPLSAETSLLTELALAISQRHLMWRESSVIAW